MKKKFHYKKILSCLLSFSILIFIASCHHYYMATQQNINKDTGKTIDSLKQQDRYFILRNGKKAYYMYDQTLSNDRKTLTCTLDSLPPDHKLYLTKGRRGVMKYKLNSGDIAVLNEVHFYIDSSESTSFGKYTLQLDKIQKIEVIEKDKGRTTGSYIIGAMGYTVGALAVAAIIIAATKSSCPFVSAYNNNEFLLQGEIYGGAVYPQLARDDYMPLLMQPTQKGTMQVKISNELHERQFTDFADIMIVTHEKGSIVLADEKGNLYQLSNPKTPEAAWTENKKDVLAPLIHKDDNALLHFDDTMVSTNYVIVKFNKPEEVLNGKLVLAIKNSYWLDYLYGEMGKGFGSYYNSYIKKQYKTPATKLLKWKKDQDIPLEVSIKFKNGWQKIADLTTIGPLATREIVVPLNLSDIKDSSFEIKLSSGFMFWEIDYAAIDFSTNKNFEIETVSSSVATDETGKNVLPELNKKDGIYLEQPVPGNVVTLEYNCKPQKPNTERSYILHTRGYYIPVRKFIGAPNIAFLNQFKKPGGFPAYSLQLYKKFSYTTMESIAKQ
jgi:hypothetical protein